MLDKQPTGPDITVTFPFDIKGSREMTGLAEARGRQIVYLAELQENPARVDLPAAAPAPPARRPRGALALTPPADPAPAPATGAAAPAAPRRQTASTPVEGFSTTDAKDFDIAIENRKTGAGVRLSGDRPLSRINFWSVRTTVCPEAYVEVKADPGAETRWKLTYDFYDLRRKT